MKKFIVLTIASLCIFATSNAMEQHPTQKQFLSSFHQAIRADTQELIKTFLENKEMLSSLSKAEKGELIQYAATYRKSLAFQELLNNDTIKKCLNQPEISQQVFLCIHQAPAQSREPDQTGIDFMSMFLGDKVIRDLMGMDRAKKFAYDAIQETALQRGAEMLSLLLAKQNITNLLSVEDWIKIYNSVEAWEYFDRTGYEFDRIKTLLQPYIPAQELCWLSFTNCTIS